MSEKNQVYLHEIILRVLSIFNYLLKRWLIIGVVAAIGASIGLIFSMKSKRMYTSELSFVVEGESMGGLAGLASSFGLGIGTASGKGVFNAANIMELLKSPNLVKTTLLRPTIKNPEKSFAELYIETYEWRKEWEKDSILKQIHFLPNTDKDKLTWNQNKILNEIQSSLSEKAIKVEIKNPENSIIYITFESSSVELSRYFPEILIEVASDYYIESKTRKAKLNYEIIQKQTDSVRRELNNAISGVAAENDNTFLLNPAYNVKRVPSALKQVNVQANQAILGELVKNLELSRMNLLNETPLIEIIDKPVSPLDSKKLGKIKAILIGGFLGAFLIIGLLLSLKFWKTLMNPTKTKKK